MNGLNEAKKPSLFKKIQVFVASLGWPYRSWMAAEAGWDSVLRLHRGAYGVSVPPRRDKRSSASGDVRPTRSEVLCTECGGQPGESWATCSLCNKSRADEQVGGF
jgi:hypothetical protein